MSLTAIIRAAQPLHPHDRGAFLEKVAPRLNGLQLGDGFVGRVARERQRVRGSASGGGETMREVGTLVLKKHLVLNAPCRCLLGTLGGKKRWDINKRLDPF
jgi:hypothetical protein